MTLSVPDEDDSRNALFGTKPEGVDDDPLPLGYTTTNLDEIVPVTIILWQWLLYSISRQKSLKIPKGKSEFEYRRKTDNTMAKRKSTKGQTMTKKHTYGH